MMEPVLLIIENAIAPLMTIRVWSIMDDEQQHIVSEINTTNKNISMAAATTSSFQPRRWVIQSMNEIVPKVRNEQKRQYQLQRKEQQQQRQSLQQVDDNNNGVNDIQTLANIKVVIDLWVLIAMTEIEWNQLCIALQTISLNNSSNHAKSTNNITSGRITSLVITRSKLGLDKSFFNQAPNLLVPPHIEDQRAKVLLQQIGYNLQYLVLDHVQNIYHTFEQLSLFCPSLIGLTLSNIGSTNASAAAVNRNSSSGIPYTRTWNTIAESIRQFQHLQDLLFHNVIFQHQESKEEKGQQQIIETHQQQHQQPISYYQNKDIIQRTNRCWIQLINAVSQISKLQSYEFKDCLVYCSDDDTDNNINTFYCPNRIPTNYRGLYKFVLTNSQTYKCDFYPRLNKAGYQKLIRGPSNSSVSRRSCSNSGSRSSRVYSKDQDKDANLSEWIEVLIAVRDRLDCIHYLICNMDPALLVSAALQKKTGLMKAKRAAAKPSGSCGKNTEEKLCSG